MKQEKEQVPVACSLSGKVLRGKLLYLILRYGSFFSLDRGNYKCYTKSIVWMIEENK